MKENYLFTPIDYLKGIGPNRASLLKSELKVFTYNDLLNYFPFRYIDRTKYHKISELEKTNSEVHLGCLDNICKYFPKALFFLINKLINI